MGKIEYYYHAYNLTVDKLCKEIKTHYLTSTVGSNIDIENDIILVHAIHETIQTTDLYKKEDIRGFLWNKIRPNCVIEERPYSSYTTEDYKSGFDSLFNFCWKQKFSMTQNIKESKKLYRIAYSKRTLWQKLISNDYILILFLVAFIYLQYQCAGKMAVVFSLGSIYMGLQAAALLYMNKPDSFYAKVPLVCMAVMLIAVVIYIFNSYLESYEIKALLKATACFLLWYPLILANESRIRDWYD